MPTADIERDGLARRDMPQQVREASVVPQTWRDEDQSVEVVWTTGARRRAYDWWTDTAYDEELEVTPEAIDATRFNAGVVQVVDSHRTDGVGRILGRALDLRIEGGEARSRLILSTDPAKAGIVADIRSGVIRAMSVGYSVERYEVTPASQRADGAKIPLYRAVRWAPMELTFCAVGADPQAGTRAAQMRSQPLHGHPCDFVARSAGITEDITMPDDSSTTKTPDVAAEQIAAERQRAADITALCARHGVPALAAQLITDGRSVDQASRVVLDEIARRDAAAGGHTNVRGIVTTQDEMQTRLDGMSESLMHRVDARVKLGDNGRRFRGYSLIEMGRDHLERAGVDTRHMTRMELAGAMLQHRSGGMMGTSDFANLLGAVANKRLRSGYEESMPSYQRWARRAPNAPDFKTMNVVNLAGAPDLLQTNEHGEFKYGSMTDGKETYSLVTYGRIVSLTRQAVVNDDLRGFDRLVSAFGNSAARLENRTVYAILTANANLADGGALFNTTAVTTTGGHANLAGSGGAISVTTLGAGRAAMRLQKGLQSEELNIAPAYLIVPATQENLAYQYTSANYVPAQASNINEFRAGGRTALEPIVEAILDASSTTAWYLAASTGSVDTVEYCFLDGAEGPVIESEVGFEVDGISYKCREDFAAKAIDFRGLYKNAGA